MAKERVRVKPATCSYVDDDHTHLTLEITLPGVEKKDIKLRMHDDSFAINAPADDVEYVTTMSFCCPVKAEQAEAKYKNGLLKVVIPFKDAMDDALTIDVN